MSWGGGGIYPEWNSPFGYHFEYFLLSFSLGSRHFDGSDSRPVSGTRLTPIDHVSIKYPNMMSNKAIAVYSTSFSHLSCLFTIALTILIVFSDIVWAQSL
jgi:hypothetical protein